MCAHYIFSYSDRFLILPYKFPNQGKGARRCCLGTILKPHLIWLFDYNFLMSFVVFSSDMKCKIFDFLQSILHNFYRCVDFMSAELTTMTLYLEFPRLLNLLNIGQTSMILFMYVRYSLMSLYYVHVSPTFELSLLLYKSCLKTSGFKWRFEVFSVATFVCWWGPSKQPRVEDMAISKDKEPLRKRGNLQGRQLSPRKRLVTRLHNAMAPVLP